MLKYFVALFLLVVFYNQVVESTKKCPCQPALCPKGWIFRRGSCYRYFKYNRTWRQAFFFCWRKGGYLVKINNRREYYIVRKMGKRFWIDGKRACRRNKTVFHYGFSIWFKGPYTRWHQGEPNNAGGIENCVHIANRFMNDNRCDARMNFVCEKRARFRKA